MEQRKQELARKCSMELKQLTSRHLTTASIILIITGLMYVDWTSILICVLALAVLAVHWFISSNKVIIHYTMLQILEDRKMFEK